MLKEELLAKVRVPHPGEVWQVEDKEIRLHATGRNDKIKRPVLVVYESTLAKPGIAVINCIPLSSSAKMDRFTFPIARSYTKAAQDYRVDSNSMALVNFYQPIEIDHFVNWCGEIDETSYNALLNMLCYDVIGFTKQFEIEAA